MARMVLQVVLAYRGDVVQWISTSIVNSVRIEAVFFPAWVAVIFRVIITVVLNLSVSWVDGMWWNNRSSQVKRGAI
jgi:hypothetical protein